MIPSCEIERTVTIEKNAKAVFHNHTAYCIGTGRMGLALQEEYQKQMNLVQELCHFKHIRGHGLFCDDMAIYQPYTDAAGNACISYNFTYLDRVMDSYLSAGLRPFLELGFMPEKLASGNQTIFYWKGNTTPPKNDENWCALIQATLRHLMERYGADDVVTWPVEVWNEPNLAGFWENADKEKYLHLYEITSRAVKAVDERFQVGGPAICGGSGSQLWVRDFLAFCSEHQVPVDFVSRHAYMAQTPIHAGRYEYHTMCDVEYTVREMQETRDIINSFPQYVHLPMHITEFNTSYNPFCPIHDTLLNAAIMAGFLARMGDVADSYSYWTFGDVFEELGVPPTPFHGGFGLVANGLIPKPTLWMFSFFANLKGQCVHRDECMLLMRRDDGSYEGIVWNECSHQHQALSIDLKLACENGRYICQGESLTEAQGNPLKAWHDMGEPASLTKAQLSFLRGVAQPLHETDTLEAENGYLQLSLQLGENEVMHFELNHAPLKPDVGYDYQWYEQHPEQLKMSAEKNA